MLITECYSRATSTKGVRRLAVGSGSGEGHLSASVLVRWEGRVHVTLGAGHYRVPGTR